MAARVEPGRVQAAHQSLHHFVAKAEWSDEAVLAVVRARCCRVERQGAIRAWIVDDTGFPKKGKHSVGVARQYCGQLGKQDNCQIAVSLSVANDHASLPIAYRLYLPETWANDAERRAKAGVPEDVVFRTKPEIALDEIQAALAAGVPTGVVLADAGYGIDTAFRNGVGDGLDLHRRHPVLDRPVAAGNRASAAQGLERARTAALAHSPASRAQAGLGQGTGADPAGERLAHRHLAGGHARAALLALRRHPRPAGTSRLLALHTAARGMVPGRVAAGRQRTDQILALDLARRHDPDRPSSTRPSSAGASSGITRSSSRRSASVTTKAEAGEASTTTPRWRSPPIGFLVSERSLIPPSGPALCAVPQGTSPTQRLSTPRLPRSDPNVTSPTRSPPVRISLAHALARRLLRCPCCRLSLMTQ